MEHGEATASTRAVPDFDALYAADPDPWEVDTSWYERRKIALVLGCLRRASYRQAWDAACGTGHLAAALAGRAERLLATDACARAVALTRARLAATGLSAASPGSSAAATDPTGAVPGSAPGAFEVTTEVCVLPAAPAGLAGLAEGGPGPDLVLLSEVLYYLSPNERRKTYDLVAGITAPDGDVVAVHWRPEPENAWCSGGQTHRELNDELLGRGWTRVVTHADEEFLIGVWSRALPERIGR